MDNQYHLFQNSQQFSEPLAFYGVDISVKFGKRWALRNVKLSIKKGEIIFITGNSGAGKSTLLNVLAGEVSAQKGHTLKREESCFIARTFQTNKLLDNFTVGDNLNIAFDSNLYHSKKEFDLEKMQMVRFMGIEDRLNIKVKDANGGLKQKISIIRALLTKPAVLLADEPTSSCDKESALKIFELLNFYNLKKKTTILWATHQQDLVRNFPGRTLHLDNGKLVYSGEACFI